jgi:hypothetical protein
MLHLDLAGQRDRPRAVDLPEEDEATFADWEQASTDLPHWQTSYRHLIADGQVASLTHASDANQTRAFPPPAEPASTGS